MGHSSLSPDLQRDAAKYTYLVRALERAAAEIKAMETEEGYDLDDLLIRLLPDITDALAAEQAFVARLDPAEGDDGPDQLFILAYHPPESAPDEQIIPAVGLLHDLLADGKPRIRTSMGRKSNSFIGGLEPLGAKATVLVRLATRDQVYIVGVCNERNPENAPFLAADRMTLNYLVETIAVNARTSERRRHELEAIKAISEQSTHAAVEQVYATIVQRAVAVTKAHYAAIWQYHAGVAEMFFVCDHQSPPPHPEATHNGPDWREYAINRDVAHQGKAWYIGDLTLHPHYAAAHVAARAIYCVPLKIDQQLLGTLYVASNIVDGLSVEDQQFIDHLAPHAAIALNNAHLQDIRQRVIRFQQKISDVLPLERQLLQIKEALGQHLHIDDLFIALINVQSKAITFPLAYHHGILAAHMEEVFNSYYMPSRLGERQGLIEYVAASRQSLLVADFTQWPGRPALRPDYPDLVSCLMAPLISRDQLIGVIGLRSYKTSVRFTEYDQRFVEALANHVAAMIRNSQQYEQRTRHNLSNLHTLRKTSALLISRAGEAIFSAEVANQQFFQAILAEAVEVTQATFGTFHLIHNGALEVEAALPAHRLQALRHEFGPIALERRTIITRAVRESRAQLVINVETDPDYFKVHEETRSLLAVVLHKHGTHEPIGVLTVEHPLVGGLAAEHKWLLITLANLAVMALNNAAQTERLSRSNAVAIMGAWGADIVHDVNREVGSIRRAIFILKQQAGLAEKYRAYLQRIDESMGRLALPELPEAAPDPGYQLEARLAPRLLDVVNDELKRLQLLNLEIRLETQFHCPNRKVAMHEQWLRRVVRHIVKNGIKAVQQNETRPGYVRVEVDNDESHATIAVIDNGQGVRPEVRNYLFKRPIAHDDQGSYERAGRGLLLVGYIMEAHGGEARLAWSTPGEGSCFQLLIPLVKES